MKAKFFIILCCFALLSVPSASADDLSLPVDVRVIEASAFENDLSLDRVILPDGLLRIEERAFAGSGVSRVHIPASVEYIAEDAFDGCENGPGVTAVKGTYGYSWAADHHLLIDNEIIVWVGAAIMDLTVAQLDGFLAAYPQYADFSFSIEEMEVADASVLVLFDPAASADVFCFPQNDLARLVNARLLSPVSSAAVESANDAGSVAAASMGGTLYAYPLTSDNGYFLYYDSSVVSDPSSLESILADCEAADRLFCMEINSGWYQVAFFFGAGCTLQYNTNASGAFTSAVCDYASQNGLRALKAMISANRSPAFANASYVDYAANVGAVVTGTWDGQNVSARFGSHFAAAKLPTVSGFQMSSFGGYKLMGVKPQADSAKEEACHALAAYLTAETAQRERFAAVAWGPSNLAVQADPAVKSDISLSALAAQSRYAVPQGQYPGDYWDIATNFGNQVLTGAFDDLSDSELMSRLQSFQQSLLSLTN